MKIIDTLTEKTATFFLYGEKNKKIADFYLHISYLLRFPDYFGNNLDALDECLNDLSWIEFEEVNVVIYEFSQFLAHENSDIKNMVVDIFECAEISGNKKINFFAKN